MRYSGIVDDHAERRVRVVGRSFRSKLDRLDALQAQRDVGCSVQLDASELPQASVGFEIAGVLLDEGLEVGAADLLLAFDEERVADRDRSRRLRARRRSPRGGAMMWHFVSALPRPRAFRRARSARTAGPSIDRADRAAGRRSGRRRGASDRRRRRPMRRRPGCPGLDGSPFLGPALREQIRDGFGAFLDAAALGRNARDLDESAELRRGACRPTRLKRRAQRVDLCGCGLESHGRSA